MNGVEGLLQRDGRTKIDGLCGSVSQHENEIRTGVDTHTRAVVDHGQRRRLFRTGEHRGRPGRLAQTVSASQQVEGAVRRKTCERAEVDRVVRIAAGDHRPFKADDRIHFGRRPEHTAGLRERVIGEREVDVARLDDRVDSRFAVERVGSAAASDPIIVATTQNLIRSAAADERVVAPVTIDHRCAGKGRGVDQVVSARPVQRRRFDARQRIQYFDALRRDRRRHTAAGEINARRREVRDVPAAFGSHERDRKGTGFARPRDDQVFAVQPVEQSQLPFHVK